VIACCTVPPSGADHDSAIFFGSPRHNRTFDGNATAQPIAKVIDMNRGAQNLRSTPFELKVRKEARFDFSQLGTAIHTEDNLYISHLFNAFTLIAPITEGMLIRAIRLSQPMLEGSGLETDAKAFIGQEAIHTREHRALNRRLSELGLNVEEVVSVIEQEVKNIGDSMSLQENLAVVVTGEHAIYSIARALLMSKYPQCQQQQQVKNLFIWHAVEEMEHQSVCDDIYKYLYGKGIKHRLFYYLTFFTAGSLLVRTMNKLMKTLLEQSREPRKGEMKEFLVWLFRNRAMGPIALKELVGFCSPTFMHWKRSDEDQKLISDNLASVYGGKLT
jgi:predicted metal-dependent hydrolase